jgi:hypothetical protein
MTRALIVALVFFVAASVIAATPPPNGPPWTVIDWPATLDKSPSTGISLGKLRIRFEMTTLEQVRFAISSGEIAQQGDAAGSVSWLCYTDIEHGQTERLWITSGEMGGNTFVTGMSARILPEAKPSAACPLLPKQFRPVSLDAAVWLGSSDQALHQALGAPSHDANSWREYDFRSKIPSDGKCEGGYDFENWLSTKSKDGRVIAIAAGQVTSC